MPVTISGTTGVNATGNIQTTGNIIGTGVCPAGVVLPFAILTPPTGWLRCDGTIIPTSGSLQGVDASLLQTLRTLLSTTYGNLGQLPNLQGQFIRGLTTNFTTTSRDPLSGSRILGSTQESALSAHFHQQGSEALYNFEGGGNYIGARTYSAGGIGSYTYANTTTVGQSNQETRPVNIALLYCIKY